MPIIGAVVPRREETKLYSCTHVFTQGLLSDHDVFE